MSESAPFVPLQTSYLFVHVTNTDATIEFWCKGLGGELESDEELAAPALDAMFEREGVRIRDTFIQIGGVRLHTIETLDVPRTFVPPSEKYALGIGGISFRVADLEASHARAEAESRDPTPIFEFSDLEEPVKMFFLNDPDGIRVEMIGA